MTELLSSVPVLYKVIFSLLLILVSSRFFKSILIPLFLGTAALAIGIGHSPEALLKIFSKCTFSLNTLFLFIVFFEIECLSIQMSESGTMKSMVAVVKAHLNRRKAMAVLPAIIGFLPMPGGALFSAPLVDDCDENREFDPILKAKINYWFRHIWEYWWPMFPGVLLAIELSRLEAWQFMLLQLPMSIFAVAIGYFFLLRRISGDRGDENVRFDLATFFSVLKLASPVITAMLVYGLIRFFIPSISSLNKYLPMCIGIFLAILLLQFLHPIDQKKWRRILCHKPIYIMILLVYAVLLYGALIEGNLPDGTPLVEKIGVEIVSFGIPKTALLVLIPFICGVSTGIAIGFVGASFPIVMGLIGENPSFATLLSTTFLAFGSGYVGMIVSPVHVCLIVTNEHFKTELMDSIKKLLLPSAVLFLLNLSCYLLMKALMR